MPPTAARRATSVALLTLLLILTGCTAGSSTPTSSPTPHFIRVTDLCVRLSQDQLTGMTGAPVKVLPAPTGRPEHVRACEFEASTPNQQSTTRIRFDAVVFPTVAEAENALPLPVGTPQVGTGRGVLPNIGDYATYDYQSGINFASYVLDVRQGNAYIMVDLMMRGPTSFDRGRIEHVVTGYARQALELMRD